VSGTLDMLLQQEKLFGVLAQSLPISRWNQPLCSQRDASNS